MKPKEVQEKYNIDANRIKFYKKEGVFIPENPPEGNRGTEYTEADCEALKLLEVLTKSGLTCGDIKKLRKGEESLSEVIKNRMIDIHAELTRKQNALRVLGTILADNAEFKTFDTDHYWDVIHQKESMGERFIDIEDMYGYRAVSLFRSIRCPHCKGSFDIDLEDYLFDESSEENEEGMGPDRVYHFNTEGQSMCPDCGAAVLIQGWIREYPLGADDSEHIEVSKLKGRNGFTREERNLLEKMEAGSFDGLVGESWTIAGGATVCRVIINGVPSTLKQSDDDFSYGKEKERSKKEPRTVQRWVTDEEKLEFLRKYGMDINDGLVRVYCASSKFKC